MNNTRIAVLLILTSLLSAIPAYAALSLEGQSGVFLNSLAFPVQKGKYEVAAHNVGLDDMGDVTTWSISTGISKDVEIGYTKLTSSVTGVKDQNILLAKWQFLKASDKDPALAVWAINRDYVGAGTTTDYGLSATKVIKVKNLPLVLDLGVRSTKALGLGMFGLNNDRELKLEGSLALFVTKNFAVGTEFKQQIGADTWKDIAFRYIASENLNLDAGIADLGPGLRNQLALGATYHW